MLSFLFILFPVYFCLKLYLIDDYFVNVYVGNSKTTFKLLIDPTYPFTYIFKPYITKTKKNAEIMPLLFSNFYGNYSGEWAIDTFSFKEENTTIQMKFLDIYYKKTNILNVDGVLGLGSYIKHDANIYYNLNQANYNCFNKIATYDRKNKQIIICDNETSSKSNNFEINFSYNTFNYPGLIPITKLNLISNKKEIFLNDEAYIGLIPLFIIPNEIKQWVEQSSFENPDSKEKNNEYQDNRIIPENLNYKIFFEDQEYIYSNDENRNTEEIKKFLNLYSFKNKILDMKNKWYFGLAQNNIEKIEFDFDKGKIKIFVNSYKYIIVRITLLIIVSIFFIYALTIVFHKKKDKNKNNETEQELMDM